MFRFAKIPDEPTNRISGGLVNFTTKSESSSSGTSSDSSSDTEDSEEERRNKQLKMLEKEVINLSISLIFFMSNRKRSLKNIFLFSVISLGIKRKITKV